jgi:hypothetical protein
MSIAPEVQAERDRCARICDELATNWETSAARIRAEGTFTTRAIWPPFRKTTCVFPGWEKAARDIEAAAHGVRAIESYIKSGTAAP